MIPEEYETLKKYLSDISPERVEVLRSISKLIDVEHSENRFLWSLLHETGLNFYNCHFLYRYLYGNELLTHLKQISLELGYI